MSFRSTLSAVFINTQHHFVSAMDPIDFSNVGRPHGGVAILWSSNLNYVVSPIPCHSKRLCCVRIEKDNIDILLINVYMPSSNCSNREQEFSDILSEVSSINDIYSDASLILGGDFNFDYIRNRDSGIVDKIGQFNTNNCTINCRELQNINSEIHYTYESKANQARSVIDHFFVSESVMADVAKLEVLSDAKNFSDHLPVVLQIRTNASHKISLPDNICKKPQWKKATEMELSNYRNVLDKN